MQECIERLYQGCEFIEKVVKHASNTEILLFKKRLNTHLQNIMGYTPDSHLNNGVDVEFVSNYQAIQVGW